MKINNLILIFSCFLIAVVGCNDIKQVDDSLYLKKIYPKIVDAELTKASLDPASGKYTWEEGDAILISNGKETAIFNYSTDGCFVCEKETFEATSSYKALYPANLYDAENSTIDEFIIIVPSAQVYDGVKVSSSVLYAEFSDGATIQMKNLLATVGIDCSGSEKAKSLELSSSSVKLCGQAKINKGVLSIVNTGVSEPITAQFTSTSPMQNVYFTVPARLYTGGLRLVINYEDGQTKEMFCDESFSLRPNLISLAEFLEPEKIFASGDGSEANPYIIGSFTQYENFVEAVNNPETYASYSNAYFKLGNDIDFESKEQPVICTSLSKAFKGGFDGANYTLRNFVVNSTEETAAGMFGYTDGATIKNIKFDDAKIDGVYTFTGAIVGHAKNTTIENIDFDGAVRSYTSKISVSESYYAPVASANAGYCGGIVGLLDESTLRNVKFNGTSNFYGKFSGGLVGCSYNSTIDQCSVSKESAVNVYYHFSGGIVGRALGANNVISNCTYEAPFTSVGYCVGGIVGQLFGGKVTKCVQGSHSYIGADKQFVGGIVGAAQPLNPIEISYCVSYGVIRGQYSVGGIVGYSGPGPSTSDKDLTRAYAGEVVIKACAFEGVSVTATGGNSSKYPIAAGILGWAHAKQTSLLSCYSRPGLIQTTYYDHVNGVLSGISGYSNGTNANFENCYSAFTVNDLLVCGNQAAANTNLWYAGIHIRCTKATTVNNCFSESTMRVGYSSAAATESGCGQFSQEEYKNGTLLQKLNSSTTEGVVWIADSDGKPTIQGLPQDPNPKPKGLKKVSVIGDSISSFKGYIPAGYSAHYPATDGTLTLVNETYWHKLIYKYMKNAELEVNIAFSGSTVTNTTEENYVKKYSTSSPAAWWHKSFPERFQQCGGMGNPDIILIHGGTNDWAHNIDPLAPGVAIRNDASNEYGGDAPSDDIMNAIFTVADAASTTEAINNLPDGTYCEAYCKLMCQIRNRHPRAKVVCIIGDYLNSAVEKSTIAIANHYGAKVVNLFRVNGFNDLGGYSPSTLTNKGSQPNMPKHDYAGEISGCHPGAQAMEFIANKIYSELGIWLEE